MNHVYEHLLQECANINYIVDEDINTVNDVDAKSRSFVVIGETMAKHLTRNKTDMMTSGNTFKIVLPKPIGDSAAATASKVPAANDFLSLYFHGRHIEGLHCEGGNMFDVTKETSRIPYGTMVQNGRPCIHGNTLSQHQTYSWQEGMKEIACAPCESRRVAPQMTTNTS